jgi:hypothetical protein
VCGIGTVNKENKEKERRKDDNIKNTTDTITLFVVPLVIFIVGYIFYQCFHRGFALCVDYFTSGNFISGQCINHHTIDIESIDALEPTHQHLQQQQPPQLQEQQQQQQQQHPIVSLNNQNAV